ncbi:MAG: 4Fe-4S dicluster domain-containing protein, partial [Pseudomonadota bacterium]
CNHCDDGPCQKVGGDAVKKRDDGITIIDPVIAKGRKDIVKACPHGAIIWNEELELPQIWTFDAHLLDQGWPRPRCVDACPPGAIEAVKITDAQMREKAEAEDLRVLRPEIGTRPRVYYKNLDLYEKCFIAGTVISMRDGIEECVEDAIVTIYLGDNKVAEVATNEFGEFKADKLGPDTGNYRIEVKHSAFGSASTSAQLGESVYVGEITLED